MEIPYFWKGRSTLQVPCTLKSQTTDGDTQKNKSSLPILLVGRIIRRGYTNVVPSIVLDKKMHVGYVNKTFFRITIVSNSASFLMPRQFVGYSDPKSSRD